MNGLVSSVSLAPSETVRTLSVPASEVSDGGYTVFLIEVGTSSRTFTVRRRYREFLTLHRSLRRRLAHVPVFPGKYLLTKKTFQVIEQRRVDLQSYMKSILSFKDARETLLDFLGIAVSAHSSASTVKPHQMTVLSYNAGCQFDTSVLKAVTEESDGDICVDAAQLSLTEDGDKVTQFDGESLENGTVRRYRQECFVTSDAVVAGVLLALGHKCTCRIHGET